MKVPYVDLPAQFAEHKSEIMQAIEGVLTSGEYILGSEVTKFEESFAKLCDVKHAISVADGTSALSLCMRVLGIGPGDEVITAPNSFFSSASSIVHVGATPVFVDVDKDQNLDPKLLEAAINDKTKAIMPVHLTGKVAQMNAICEIAKKHNIAVIEDSAQAVGAEYYGKKSGSIGDLGCFSLHPLKNLNAAGDAGLITTNSDQLAEKLRRIRNHGMIDRENIPEFGYNSRLDSIQAAILNTKLPYLSDVTDRRRKNAQLYREQLGGLVECPADAPNCFDVYHLFVIQADKRDELKDFLGENGIATAIHYPISIHLFECSKQLGYKKGDFPETERQATRILSLPIHQNLSSEQITYVCQKIKEFYQ